jgi:hypothetical protein
LSSAMEPPYVVKWMLTNSRLCRKALSDLGTLIQLPPPNARAILPRRFKTPGPKALFARLGRELQGQVALGIPCERSCETLPNQPCINFNVTPHYRADRNQPSIDVAISRNTAHGSIAQEVTESRGCNFSATIGSPLSSRARLGALRSVNAVQPDLLAGDFYSVAIGYICRAHNGRRTSPVQVLRGRRRSWRDWMLWLRGAYGLS